MSPGISTTVLGERANKGKAVVVLILRRERAQGRAEEPIVLILILKRRKSQLRQRY